MALQVWLPLNGNLNNQGLDTGVFTNTCSATISTSGKIGSCYEFSTYTGMGLQYPSSSVATFMNTYINNHSWTMCAWIKSTATDTAVLGLTYGLRLFAGSTTKVSLYNSTTTVTAYGSKSTADGLWHHLAATYNVDTNAINVYVDGVSGTTVYYPEGSTYSSSWTNAISVGRDHNNSSAQAHYYYQGSMNDVRIYDECLSARQIKEISKGLVLHYPLNDGYTEGTTNIAPSPYKSSYPSYSPSWDSTKHTNAVSVNGWSGGYNGGVSNPDTGYHAMWNIIDGIPTMVFQNHNSEISQKGRWLGICASLSTAVTSTITAGTKYTISFDIKAVDNIGGYCTSGIYYKLTSSATSAGFNDGCPSFGTITSVGDWNRVSYTFTRNASFDGNTLSQSIYVYGMYGTESTIYVRNVQLEVKDHATPYVDGTRSTGTVYDCSGFGYNGTIAGSLPVISGSARYNKCTNWPTATSAANNIHSPIIYQSGEAITMNIWIKTTTTGGSSYQMPFESNSRCYCEMSITSSGQLRGGLYVGGTRYVTNVGSGLLDGNWHMITITYDGSTIRRYIDAVEYASTSVSGALNNTAQSYWLGVLGTDTSYYNSNIAQSDARLYATALSASDIKELYNAPIKIANNGTLLTDGEVIE